MLLSLQKRCNDDERTIGELFFMMVDELADMTFAYAMQLTFDAMLQIVRQHFALSDDQFLAFTQDFFNRLPPVTAIFFTLRSLADFSANMPCCRWLDILFRCGKFE